MTVDQTVLNMIQESPYLIRNSLSADRMIEIEKLYAANISPYLTNLTRFDGDELLYDNIFMFGYIRLSDWMRDQIIIEIVIFKQILAYILSGMMATQSISHGEIRITNIFINPKDNNRVILGPLGERVNKGEDMRNLSYIILTLMSKGHNSTLHQTMLDRLYTNPERITASDLLPLLGHVPLPIPREPEDVQSLVTTLKQYFLEEEQRAVKRTQVTKVSKPGLIKSTLNFITSRFN